MKTTVSAQPLKVAAPASGDLQMPKSAVPPRFDANEWGGRFPDNRYFPFYLANGRDATLINISGSGDGHWERAPYGSDVISKLHAIGWYKADRRVKNRPECGAYGPLVCLGEFTACPTMRNDFVVPREVAQYFDPKSATLTTFYSQRDHSGNQIMDLRIETCMTSAGVLIQEIEVLGAPECGVGYAFSLATVSPGYQNFMIALAPPDTCTMQPSEDGAEVRMISKWGDLDVHAFSLVGEAKMGAGSERSIPSLGFKEYEQTLQIMKTGARFWRVVSFQDNREGDNPKEVCDALIKDIRQNGIRHLREKHLIEWQEYFAQSAVELPDAAAQHVYELSRYVIKANHHPGGFQPVGLLPYQWQGVMFWDAATAMEAFASCGNMAEAKSICGQIKRLMPAARALAAKLGNDGARLEWTNNLDTFTPYDPPGRQFHNNAVWARAFCLLDEYLADSSHAALEPARELLHFLVEEFERHGSTGNHHEAFIGIDESESDPKPYDTWTCCVLLKALEQYEELCRQLGVASGIPQAERVMEKLTEIREGNIDEDGVLQSFRGGKMPHFGSLVFDMFPEHPAALTTLSAMSKNYDAERDIFNFHGLSRYAERTFPWATFSASRCLAKTGHTEAHQFFLHNLKHVNYFGGLAERKFYHGEGYIEWFSTAHAALIMAMNTMLASEVDGRIRLLGGVDLSLWDTLSFEKIHVGKGWEISFSLQRGKVTRCVVRNLAAEPRELTVEVPALDLKCSFTAQPGVNTVELAS